MSSVVFWFYLKPQKTVSILENNSEEVFNLLAHWSHGNIVAIIRHTERCDKSENKCLEESKKGITVKGKEVAIELGNNFRTLLPIDNAIIYNSPLMRTHQTANFMFKEASVSKEWLFYGCKENFLKDMLAYKKTRKNLILITHSGCFRKLGEAEGNRLINMEIDEKTYGIALFIAIDEFANQTYVLGHLFPDDWIKAIEIYDKKISYDPVDSDIK